MDIEVEKHALEPFLPKNTKVLFLGSFPPPRDRWCMDFFYPNFINDHWRIEGLVFFDDKNHFVDTVHKTFRLPEIVEFLNKKGIGYFDSATAVRRLKKNASDNFLEIVEATDITALLRQIPQCRVVAATGEKAARTLCEQLNIKEMPPIGGHTAIPSAKNFSKGLHLYRLPSSSRAYPLPLEKKAEAYCEMFRFAEIIKKPLHLHDDR